METVFGAYYSHTLYASTIKAGVVNKLALYIKAHCLTPLSSVEQINKVINKG